MKAPSGRRVDPSAAHLIVEHEFDDQYVVKLHVDRVIQHEVETIYNNGHPLPPGELMRFNRESGELTIFPLITYSSPRLYRRKYEHIREITLEFDPSILTENLGRDDAEAILEHLPSGLIRQFEYGLGVVRELRPMIDTIEQIKGITGIKISKLEPTGQSGNIYTINEDDFRSFASAMNAISRKYLQDSLRDRRLMAHNELLHKLAPSVHAYKERPYEPGTVFKMLGGTRASEAVLKGRDRKAILSTVATNAESIAKRDPKEFIQLQKDIEVVSLDRLIDAMGRYICRNVREAKWQELLEANPFLLSMLFGQPIVRLQAGAYVGGQTLAGDGTKIADFLNQHAYSYNASIVELKRSGTPLLAASDYRPGVFGPHSNLTATVTQVLDQRLKLLNEVASIKHRSRIHDLETYAVDCVIVAGLFPTEANRIASFEMYRSQLKDIRIITFDELLEKIKLLREQLSGIRYEGSDDDDEEELEGEDEMELSDAVHPDDYDIFFDDDGPISQ